MPDNSAERLREHSEEIPGLEWPDPTRDSQHLVVVVQVWFFSVVSSSLNKFDFEGQWFTTDGPLNSLKVASITASATWAR